MDVKNTFYDLMVDIHEYNSIIPRLTWKEKINFFTMRRLRKTRELILDIIRATIYSHPVDDHLLMDFQIMVLSNADEFRVDPGIVDCVRPIDDNIDIYFTTTFGDRCAVDLVGDTIVLTDRKSGNRYECGIVVNEGNEFTAALCEIIRSNMVKYLISVLE